MTTIRLPHLTTLRHLKGIHQVTKNIQDRTFQQLYRSYCSGRYRSKNAVEMALKKINAEGGFNGANGVLVSTYDNKVPRRKL